MTTSILDSGRWAGKALAGQWKTLEGGTIDVTEPATGKQLGRVARANGADVRASASIARKAQKAWAAVPYTERSAVFNRAAGLLEAHRAEVATWIIRETGSILPKAAFEIDSVLHLCREAAAMLTQPKGLVLPSVDGVMSMARRMPHGLVGIISPFNFPFLLTSRSTL